MSQEQLASHIFHRFLGRNPDDKERNDLVVRGLGHDGYLWHDERWYRDDAKKLPILLFYTSCHAEQFLSYLKQHRPEIIDSHYIFVLFTHRLLLYRGYFSLELVHAIFGHADLVITNPMNPKFEELSTIPLLPHCQPSCKIATFVPPSVSAFWPVVEVFGEEPVAKAMLDGLTADETVARYLAGTLDCLFEQRYQSQLERLRLREKDCDVAISDFIDRHHRDHKLFFTSNHPTFPLVGFIMEWLLSWLGFPPAGADPISLPTNGANFSNHYPETDYEWKHYGFTYPKRWEREWGGADKFYPGIIRKAFETIKDPQHVLSTPVTPVELEP
jgi:hypothetical protein